MLLPLNKPPAFISPAVETATKIASAMELSKATTMVQANTRVAKNCTTISGIIGRLGTTGAPIPFFQASANIIGEYHNQPKRNETTAPTTTTTQLTSANIACILLLMLIIYIAQ